MVVEAHLEVAIVIDMMTDVVAMVDVMIVVLLAIATAVTTKEEATAVVAVVATEKKAMEVVASIDTKVAADVMTTALDESDVAVATTTDEKIVSVVAMGVVALLLVMMPLETPTPAAVVVAGTILAKTVTQAADKGRPSSLSDFWTRLRLRLRKALRDDYFQFCTFRLTYGGGHTFSCSWKTTR